MPFSAWKDDAVGGRVLKLFNVADYNARIAGYRDVERFAVEQGATIPLLQSVLTVVRKRNLQYTKYGNGWVLPQTLQWS
jgi:peptide/nickel transport system substrate-binding protein